MQVIPVIDVKQNQAVHAIRGERERYCAVQSPFCDSADPVALAVALRDKLGTNHLYVAELDAIDGKPLNEERLRHIGSKINYLWLDVGCRDEPDFQAIAELRTRFAQQWTIVLPLENLRDSDSLRRIVSSDTNIDLSIFSLDMRAGVPMGNAHWQALGDALSIARLVIALGCKRLLLLDLASVGASGGPSSLELLAKLKRESPHVSISVGGGVRNERDLQTLAEAGCDFALVATAIHSGELSVEQIQPYVHGG